MAMMVWLSAQRAPVIAGRAVKNRRFVLTADHTRIGGRLLPIDSCRLRVIVRVRYGCGYK
jgi:hypothetical protein